jgi:hypothetical protein
LNNSDLAAALEIVLELARRPAEATNSMDLKDAAFVAGISESQMRRRCQLLPFGIVAGGYGLKGRGERPWKVVILPFLMSLPLVAILRFRDSREQARSFRSQADAHGCATRNLPPAAQI